MSTTGIDIPQGELDEMADGVRERRESPQAEEICTIRSPSTLDGNIPYEKLRSELPEDRPDGKDVPPDGEVAPSGTEKEKEPYDAKKQVGSRKLSIEDEINYAGEFGRDAMEDEMDKAVGESLFYVDEKLADFLVDTNVHSTKAALNTWDDEGATSEPWKTMRDAAKDWKADTCVISEDLVEDLRSHPDTKEQYANYSGTGMVGEDIVEEMIRQVYRTIRNVHVLHDIQNAAALGLPLEKQELFSGGLWFGHQSDLFMIDPDPAEATGITNPGQRIIQTGRFSSKLQAYRFVDYIRTRKELGTVVTGAA